MLLKDFVNEAVICSAVIDIISNANALEDSLIWDPNYTDGTSVDAYFCAIIVGSPDRKGGNLSYFYIIWNVFNLADQL